MEAGFVEIPSDFLHAFQRIYNLIDVNYFCDHPGEKEHQP
jgi:hypothetical protein